MRSIRPLQPSPATAPVTVAGVQMPQLAGDPARIPDKDEHFYMAPHATDICMEILQGKNVLLTGHMGTGKTSVVEQIAARVGQSVMRVNMNGQTTVGDFVGMWTVKGGETIWVDGALPTAMREGHWLVLDELDFAEAPILSVLNPVLEPNGKLFLKEKGPEVVKPHPNFRLFGTANTVGVMEEFRSLYQGTNTLNAAFLDRWRVHHVDYLAPTQEVEVLLGKYPELQGDPDLARQMVRVASQARVAFEKGQLDEPMSLRRLLDWTESTIDHECPVRGAQSTIFAKVSRADHEVLEGVITRTLLGGPTQSAQAQAAGTSSMARAAETAGVKAPKKASGTRSI